MLEADGMMLLGYSLEMNILAFALGSVRLFVFLQTAPFAGPTVTAPVRTAITIALYGVLHPAILASLPELFPLSGTDVVVLLALLLKEVALGFVLGWLAGMVFWTIESAGFFIDNQRGASMAQLTDPLSSDSTSPVGSFFFQALNFIFYSGGAFVTTLALLYSTYEIWPVGQALPYSLFTNHEAALFFGRCVARLSVDTVLLAAPVVLACLFTDISLGIINRFASQLNVYVLAMGVKSGIAAFLLLLYLAVLIVQGTERFGMLALDLKQLQGFL